MGISEEIGGNSAVKAVVEGIPLSVGADYNFIPDTKLNKAYSGITIYKGVGTPGVECHVE